MKTTLEVFCEVFGWQGGTIHQAKERFAIASAEEMDRMCSALNRQLPDISDADTALWFMTHRREASGLVIRAMKAGN